jgi:hypothetical protein
VCDLYGSGVTDFEGYRLTEWLEYTSDWGYWINPDTFFTPRIKKSIRVGAVFFEKKREFVEDIGREIIVTTYGVVRTHGTEEMDKRDVSKVLAKQMYEFMSSKNMYPPKTSFKKAFANGNVDLAYDPSDYDKFTIRMTPDIVGGNVEEFLDTLDSFKEETAESSGERWKVEPAKSSRSTCKTCGKKIEKEALRLGEPSMFDDHVTYKWHHLSCQSRQLRWMELDSFDGYSELTDEQKSQLQDLKGD